MVYGSKAISFRARLVNHLELGRERKRERKRKGKRERTKERRREREKERKRKERARKQGDLEERRKAVSEA